jgi:hypothetical protein
MTIIEAVLQVMQERGTPMSPSQVLEAIQSKNLYSFRAQSPIGVVRSNMRRHSDACPPALAVSKLFLKANSKEAYSLLPAPVQRVQTVKHRP